MGTQILETSDISFFNNYTKYAYVMNPLMKWEAALCVSTATEGDHSLFPQNLAHI